MERGESFRRINNVKALDPEGRRTLLLLFADPQARARAELVLAFRIYIYIMCSLVVKAVQRRQRRPLGAIMYTQQWLGTVLA